MQLCFCPPRSPSLYVASTHVHIHEHTHTLSLSLFQFLGIKGFYRGVVVNMMRAIPSAAVEFYCVEEMRKWLF
jgi:Mitochondrial carrier protein